MPIREIEDVLMHGLKDLLSAEKSFCRALPKLAKAAQDPDLVEAFTAHCDETETQISRLEKCFVILDRAPRSEKCEAASGLTLEAEGAIAKDGEGPAKDVLLAMIGRKVEAYEIASYEDAIALAQQLDKKLVAVLLEVNLAEERAASSNLQEIANRLSEAAGIGAA